MSREEISLYANDVVSFKYNGGSTPGKRRTVLVLSGDDNKNVKTFDFTTGELRTFTMSKMSELEYPECKIVNMNMLPLCTNPHLICDDFTDDGYMAYYQENDKVIIAVKLTPDQPQIVDVWLDNDSVRIQLNTEESSIGIDVENLTQLLQQAGIL